MSPKEASHNCVKQVAPQECNQRATQAFKKSGQKRGRLMTQAPIGISPINSRRSITVTVRKKYDSHVISSRGDATSVSCCGCCAAKLYHTVTLRTKVHSHLSQTGMFSPTWDRLEVQHPNHRGNVITCFESVENRISLTTGSLGQNVRMWYRN